jgi:hypothetical protein
MYQQCTSKKTKKVNKNNGVPVVPAKLKFTHTVKKCVDFRFCVQNAYMETEKRWYKWYKWYRDRKDQ